MLAGGGEERAAHAWNGPLGSGMEKAEKDDT